MIFRVSYKLVKRDILFLSMIVIICFSDIISTMGLNIIIPAFLSAIFFIILKNKNPDHLFVMIFFGVLFLIMYYLNVLFLNNYSSDFFIFPFIILGGYILSISTFDPNEHKNAVILILLLNFFTLILEKLNGYYLLDAGHQFHLRQGQGIFTWTKIQGEFLIAIACLFPKSRIILFILLLSSLFSGVRASQLFILVLALLAFSRNISLKTIIFLICSLFFLYCLNRVFDYQVFRAFDSFTITRILYLLDSSSSIYSVRTQVHSWHLDCISNYSLAELFLGNGRYCEDLYNWGAESTVLHLIEHYGLVVSLFLLSTYIILFGKTLKKKNYQTCLILTIFAAYFWNWRFGLGFLGIFIWWYIFSSWKDQYHIPKSRI